MRVSLFALYIYSQRPLDLLDIRSEIFVFRRTSTHFPMYLTKDTHFPSFSPFRFAGKRPPVQNLDLMSRTFDENILRRLKPLIAGANPPSTSLSWLSLAIDLVSSTYADAETLISDLRSSSGSEDSLASYLDDSVKLLDICNSISSEIEMLLQSRLLIHFVIHLLDFPGECSQIPSPEKLHRASNSLSDWKNFTPVIKKPRNLQNPAALIRDLALGLGNPPRGKITTVEKFVHRTIYAVGVVTVFLAGVVVAALTGSPGTIQIRVVDEFLWADAFNDLESEVSREIQKMFNGETRRLLHDLDDVDARAKSVRDVIDYVADEDFVVVGGDGDRKKRLETAVKQLETATGEFSDGLDRLLNSVNGLFHTVLCTRNGMLGNFSPQGIK